MNWLLLKLMDHRPLQRQHAHIMDQIHKLAAWLVHNAPVQYHTQGGSVVDRAIATLEAWRPKSTTLQERQTRDLEDLRGQIDRLGTWFLDNAPDRIIEGGAVDVAIATLEAWRPKKP